MTQNFFSRERFQIQPDKILYLYPLRQTLSYADWIFVWNDFSFISEETIRTFLSYVVWYDVSRNLNPETISEDFMLEFKNELNWQPVARDYPFSEKFLEKNYNLLNLEIILSRKNLLINNDLKDFLTKHMNFQKFIRSMK